MTTDDMGLVASGISVWAADGRSLVDDVTIQARAGHTLVIVGESGAGKSMLARTICALTPHSLRARGLRRRGILRRTGCQRGTHKDSG